jgi:hypothetical protein
MNREEAWQRLARDVKHLGECCRDVELPGIEVNNDNTLSDSPPCTVIPFGWPTVDGLKSIGASVTFLLKFERKKRPRKLWKAFEVLDKRRRSLRLVRRINDLATRAIEELKQRVGESDLEKAARCPDSIDTQNLFRDCLLQKGKFSDLLKAHNSSLKVRMAAHALLDWLCRIGHPAVQGVSIFEDAPAFPASFYAAIDRDVKAIRQRHMNRERQKRHRQRKDSLLKERYRRTH